MHKIFDASLPMFAAFALLGLSAATSDAAWPRYRVSASYSLPSAPAYRPVYPVAPAYLPQAPAYAVPNYGVPNYAAPSYVVPAANVAPSYYGQPNLQLGQMQSAPNTSYYAPPAYAPAPTTSYYGPQQQAIQPYVQPMQPAGGFYQPTRPSSFYSPTPGYFYPQPVFGRY